MSEEYQMSKENQEQGPNVLLNFTRYLYVEQDVAQALVTNILIKNRTNAHFWAEELHQSGCIDTIVNAFWNLYFNFYFSLNPEFYNYLLNQTKNIRKEQMKGIEGMISLEGITSIHNIVSNFMIRPSSSEAFYSVCNDNEIDMSCILTDNIDTYLETTDIAQTNRNKIGILFRNLDKLRNNPEKISGGEIDVPEEVEMHARVSLINAYINKSKMGKKLFITYKDSHDHITPECNQEPSHILQDKCIISISDELSYNTYDDNPTAAEEQTHPGASAFIEDAYRTNWLFYTKGSPLWKKRVEKYGGMFIEENKCILWCDEQQKQMFYEKYDYQAENQPNNVVRHNLALGLRRMTANEFCACINSLLYN